MPVAADDQNGAGAGKHPGGPVRGLLTRLAPPVATRLVPDEGEFIVDEVPHHWVVYVPRGLEALLALGLLALATVVPLGVAWLPLLAAAVFLARAAVKALADHVDRFVITNLRVFRSWGLVNQQLATMPIQRILDISVAKPVLGRILGYGHFVFESAAQDQGLRDIRYVARPFERDLTMQRVIQRAGLRRGANADRAPELRPGGDPPPRNLPDPGGAPAAGGPPTAERRPSYGRPPPPGRPPRPSGPPRDR